MNSVLVPLPVTEERVPSVNAEFEEFPKIPRLSRNCIVTEKIDGTNAQILIEQVEHSGTLNLPPGAFGHFDGVNYWVIKAGSRNRWLTLGKEDNYGFCGWVWQNASALVRELGPGRHYGEWWGNGIQRSYGVPEKRFSLFNTTRWAGVPLTVCRVVPVLYEGRFDTDIIESVLVMLSQTGSHAAPGFMKPEGIVIYHTGGNLLFKKTVEKDELPKGQLAA